MDASKMHEIIEEACKYVDATRYYEGLGVHIRLIQQRGLRELSRATSSEQRAEINDRLAEEIRDATDKGVRIISPPMTALNGLIQPADGPVHFRHHGQEMRVVPKDDPTKTHQNFDIERKDGKAWTSV